MIIDKQFNNFRWFHQNLVIITNLKFIYYFFPDFHGLVATLFFFNCEIEYFETRKPIITVKTIA